MKSAKELSDELGVPVVEVYDTVKMGFYFPVEESLSFSDAEAIFYAEHQDDPDADFGESDEWICSEDNRFATRYEHLLSEATRERRLSYGWGVYAINGLASMKPSCVAQIGDRAVVLAPAYPGAYECAIVGNDPEAEYMREFVDCDETEDTDNV